MTHEKTTMLIEKIHSTRFDILFKGDKNYTTQYVLRQRNEKSLVEYDANTGKELHIHEGDINYFINLDELKNYNIIKINFWGDGTMRNILAFTLFNPLTIGIVSVWYLVSVLHYFTS